MLSFECTSILVYNYLQKLALQYDDKNDFIFKIIKDGVQVMLKNWWVMCQFFLIFGIFDNFNPHLNWGQPAPWVVISKNLRQQIKTYQLHINDHLIKQKAVGI